MNVLTEAREQIQRLLTPSFGAEPISIKPAKPGLEADLAVPVFGLAKVRLQSPIELASELAASCDLSSTLFANVTAAGGYLNFQFNQTAVTRRIWQELGGEAGAYGSRQLDQPATVVVDYSSPNAAKEMHVGHIRSTIIGDALVRIYEFLGYTVIRQNHLGDWGTQFGMMIELIIDEQIDLKTLASIGALNDLYQRAKQRFDDDPDFKERAQKRVVTLQQGDPESQLIWNHLIAESLRHMNEMYGRLGVLLTDADVCGESFYNPRLPRIVEMLKEAGILQLSQGAWCVLSDGSAPETNDPFLIFRDGAWQSDPFIVQKTDGGFGYATTDLAALHYRTQELGAWLVIYVIDNRQSGHMQKLFAAARCAGWLNDEHKAVHVAFGTILGDDGKPFKTRAGGVVTLGSLLDDAFEAAAAIVAMKQAEKTASPPLLNSDAQAALAKLLSVGALKYGDLKTDRERDAKFSLTRMVSFSGNSFPYLAYVSVRIQSILRKSAGEELAVVEFQPAALTEPTEITLLKQLAAFPDAVQLAADTYKPHHIADWCYATATAFTAFYDAVPILGSDEPALRATRLDLCRRTAAVLKTGLGLLGLELPDRM